MISACEGSDQSDSAESIDIRCAVPDLLAWILDCVNTNSALLPSIDWLCLPQSGYIICEKLVVGQLLLSPGITSNFV